MADTGQNQERDATFPRATRRPSLSEIRRPLRDMQNARSDWLDNRLRTPTRALVKQPNSQSSNSLRLLLTNRQMQIGLFVCLTNFPINWSNKFLPV
jgi:hypothetical protein